MKKLLSTLLISTAVFGGAQIVAAQDVIGAGEADIAVNGTLGANNTDPGSTIPEGDTDWINVTVPTETIFYNKATDATIKAPTYDITNNSGRPVTVSVKSFTGQEEPLEQEMATHFSILAWEIPWTEEPGSPWGCKESDVTERLRFLIKENIWF